jgi:hypothetical protein
MTRHTDWQINPGRSESIKYVVILVFIKKIILNIFLSQIMLLPVIWIACGPTKKTKSTWFKKCFARKDISNVYIFFSLELKRSVEEWSSYLKTKREGDFTVPFTKHLSLEKYLFLYLYFFFFYSMLFFNFNFMFQHYIYRGLSFIIFFN